MSISKVLFVAFCTFGALLLFIGELSIKSVDINDINKIGLVYPSVSKTTIQIEADKIPELPTTNIVEHDKVRLIAPVKIEGTPISNPVVQLKKFENIISEQNTKPKNYMRCPNEVSSIYDEFEIKLTSPDNPAWCNEQLTKHKVQIGRTWGTAPRNIQIDWDNRMCNDIISNKGNIIN